MRRAVVAVVAMLGLLAACGGAPKPQSGPASAPAPTPSANDDGGKRLPDVTLDALATGAPIRLSDLKGTPTVINLWASWCGPCKKELPLFAKAHRELGSRVRILGIDFADTSPDAARRLAAHSGVTYPLYADPESRLKKDLRIIGLPQTVFVDVQGIIVSTERGTFLTYADLSAAMNDKLGVKP